MRRLIFPVVLGFTGCGVLVCLGIWQVQRLAWKEDVLAEIAARIGAVPVALPVAPRESTDEYRPVVASGALTGDEIHVLISAEGLGAGYRNVGVLVTDDGRRVLADRGFVALAAKDVGRAAQSVTLTGNLLWPDEVDSWTPAPDLGRNIWFARDLPAMAEALETEPVLIVVRTEAGANTDVVPLPIDMGAIPNDHLNYAITWFSLALVWAAMTGFLIQRTLRRKD